MEESYHVGLAGVLHHAQILRGPPYMRLERSPVQNLKVVCFNWDGSIDIVGVKEGDI
jgi:hypothetical protein